MRWGCGAKQESLLVDEGQGVTAVRGGLGLDGLGLGGLHTLPGFGEMTFDGLVC